MQAISRVARKEKINECLESHRILSQYVSVPRILNHSDSEIQFELLKEPLHLKVNRLMLNHSFLRKAAKLLNVLHNTSVIPIEDLVLPRNISFISDCHINNDEELTILDTIKQKSGKTEFILNIDNRNIKITNIKHEVPKNLFEYLYNHIFHRITKYSGYKNKILQILKDNHKLFSEKDVCYVHGDFHKKNMIDTGDLHLIDFETGMYYDYHMDIAVLQEFLSREKFQYFLKIYTNRINSTRLKINQIIYIFLSLDELTNPWNKIVHTNNLRRKLFKMTQ